MADNNKNLKNCRIFVRDSITGELVADTLVEGYDAKRNVMNISASAIRGPAENRLSLLVLTKGGVLEFSGNLRKFFSGMAEIALFGERKKEDRNFTRYDVNTEGRVEALLIGSNRVDLRKPVPVFILNLSANGILFRGDIDAFRRGSKVRVRIGLKDTAFVGEYEIVRSQNRNKETAEYGCRNILPEGEPEEEDEEISDPKQRREEAAKKRIHNGEKIDNTGYAPSMDNGQVSYDRLQQELEQAYGYTGWLNRAAALGETEDTESEAFGKTLRLLAEDIYKQVIDTDEAAILNCIHRKRPEEERDKRHTLNMTLIGALMGKWLQFDEEKIIKLIEMGLMGETDENALGEKRNPVLYTRILTVFFVLFGITAGIYAGSFLNGKPKWIFVGIPAVTASAMTTLMYIGEMILLKGRLYRFGSGFLFRGLFSNREDRFDMGPAPVDLIIMLASGIICACILKAFGLKTDEETFDKEDEL